MYVELTTGDWVTSENAFQAFKLNDLYGYTDNYADRLRWRVKAYARLAGVDWRQVTFDFLDLVGLAVQPLEPTSDDLLVKLPKLFEWHMGSITYDDCIMAAWLSENWGGTNFDYLDDVLGDYFYTLFEGSYGDWAKELADDGVLPVPDPAYADFIDWEELGEHLAGDYDVIEVGDVTYLFHQ